MQIRLDFFDLLLFAIMVSAFVIGIHQSIYHGVVASYWLFMFSMLAFLWLNKRLKKKRPEQEKPEEPASRKKPGKRK
jgi:hypothetical protein